nr:unnamed protein product [Callosobruchus chinensis]
MKTSGPNRPQPLMSFKCFHECPELCIASTINLWLKGILQVSGIDTNIFSSHSTRHAATSAACPLGENLNCFPMRGHLFILPDRAFGNIEKEIRKREEIKKPEEYFDIFSRYSTVIRIGEEVQIFDLKHHSKRPQTNQLQVRGEVNFKGDLDTAKPICKRGKRIEKKIPTITALLKGHYGEKWKEDKDLDFYMFVLDEAEKQSGEDEREDEICEYVDEGPSLKI